MGLFGTIVSVDTEENKAVIGVPGTTPPRCTLQAILKAVQADRRRSGRGCVLRGPGLPRRRHRGSGPDSPAALDDTPRRPEDTGENGPDDQRPEGNRP